MGGLVRSVANTSHVVQVDCSFASGDVHSSSTLHMPPDKKAASGAVKRHEPLVKGSAHALELLNPTLLYCRPTLYSTIERTSLCLTCVCLYGLILGAHGWT